MKTEIHSKEDDYNTRRIEAMIVTRADLERIETKLPESCELIRDEEASEASGRSVWQLTGHGDEPLGEVQKALRAALPHWDGELPKELGYDTDSMGIGCNAIYLVILEEEPCKYTAVYRVNRQYLTEDGKQLYGHYAIVGASPQAVLAEVQEDANDFDVGGIWKGDTLLYLIVRECDEQRNMMTDILTLAETGTIADDEAIAIRCRYEKLSAKSLMPMPVRTCRELFHTPSIDELFEECSQEPEE